MMCYNGPPEAVIDLKKIMLRLENERLREQLGLADKYTLKQDAIIAAQCRALADLIRLADDTGHASEAVALIEKRGA